MLACVARPAGESRRRLGLPGRSSSVCTGRVWPGATRGRRCSAVGDVTPGQPGPTMSCGEYAGQARATPRPPVRRSATIVEAAPRRHRAADACSQAVRDGLRDARRGRRACPGARARRPSRATTREPFDAEATYQAALLEEQVVAIREVPASRRPAGPAADADVLADEAAGRATFGETGAATLLRRLQARCTPVSGGCASTSWATASAASSCQPACAAGTAGLARRRRGLAQPRCRAPSRCGRSAPAIPGLPGRARVLPPSVSRTGS